MSFGRQVIWITLGAVAGFFLLRSLPDTHCAFLHVDHQPVLIGGIEFCGENEESNFYSPAELKFPFKLSIEPRADNTGGTLRVLDEAGHDIPPHIFALSHTRQLHLHLVQLTGGRTYLHVHPEPQIDGSWKFDFPQAYTEQFAGGEFRVYADFMHERSRHTVLLSTTATWPSLHSNRTPESASLFTQHRAEFLELPVLRAGESELLRVRLSRKDGTPLALQPLMGALGHAVLVGSQPGYAHMHPSWTGREVGPTPELAFRLRLPAAGKYTLWVHINDGTESYLTLPVEVIE